LGNESGSCSLSALPPLFKRTFGTEFGPFLTGKNLPWPTSLGYSGPGLEVLRRCPRVPESHWSEAQTYESDILTERGAPSSAFTQTSTAVTFQSEVVVAARLWKSSLLFAAAVCQCEQRAASRYYELRELTLDVQDRASSSGMRFVS
jgi:hypothetical protein